MERPETSLPYLLKMEGLDSKLPSKSKQEEIDKIISELPLFLPFYDNDMEELRVRPETVVERFNYHSTPNDEFDYWLDKYSKRLRVIHLDNLIKWLKDRGVSQQVIDQIPKKQTSCPMEAIEEKNEINMFEKLGACV